MTTKIRIFSFLMIIGLFHSCDKDSTNSNNSSDNPFDSPSDTLSDGLIAYYPFDGDAKDKSFNDNNGVVYGATLTSDRNGKENSAFSFDGINDFINVPDSEILQITNQITMCAWIKTDYSTPYDAIINKINPNAPSTGYGLCTYENNTFLGKIYKNHSEEIGAVIKSELNIANNKWHLIGFTYDGKLAKLYLDKKLIGTMLYTEGIQKNKSPLLIGFDYNSYLGDRHFKGIIDDVRIYNRALNSSEFEKLYDLPSDNLNDGLGTY